jgi:HEAT repeats
MKLLLVSLLLVAAPAVEQQLPIGIVDFYGLERVSEADLQRALTIKEGDTISVASGRPAVLGESEKRLLKVPGVVRAQVSLVCCDEGRGIVYVGIEEKGRPTLRFLPAPSGSVRLPADIVKAGAALQGAFMAAVQRGDSAEDDSQGHALFNDPASRAIQQQFVFFAARDQARLRQVLHESSDGDHRALAAEVLAYAANKDDIIDDLVTAMRDPYSDVRNNAMRALAILARAPVTVKLTRKIPYDNFIALLGSLVWTDRNKAALALNKLTEERSYVLVEQIWRQALQPLVDMARWKNLGHSTPALEILMRIAALPDDSVAKATTPAAREEIIQAALGRRQ